MNIVEFKAILDLIEQGINVAKQIGPISALDEGSKKNITYILRTNKQKVEDQMELIDKGAQLVERHLPNAYSAIDKVTTDFIIATEEEAAKLYKAIKEAAQKPHGSKVKFGRFKGCRIIYDGLQSYIQTNDETGTMPLLIPLNLDCIKACRFDRKKVKPHKLTTHYYYNVVFHDNSECYIRVSEKHCKNLDICVEQTANDIVFTLLPPAKDEEMD